MKEISKKVCLLGDPGVGKSCLIKRFIDDRFSDKYSHTAGTKIFKKDLEFQDMEVHLSLQLWDVVGPRTAAFLEGYLGGTAGVMAVCDVSRDETLASLDVWMAAVRQTAQEVPVVLVANKSDLTDSSMIDSQSVAIAARRFKAPYYMTSAKTGANVELSFRAIGRMVLGEAPLAV
jgi:small GTP-binding protein